MLTSFFVTSSTSYKCTWNIAKVFSLLHNLSQFASPQDTRSFQFLKVEEIAISKVEVIHGQR